MTRRRWPSARSSVLFESWRGRYSDGPRAISEELGRRGSQLHRVWSINDPDVELPADVVGVRRHSPAYLYYLFNARYIVANDLLARYYRKLRTSTYIQMVHGTPLKRVAFDLAPPRFPDGERYLRHVARDVAAWDYLVSPNAYSTAIFRRAFRYEGEVLELGGYPRNDVLAGPDAERIGAQVRKQLDIPAGRKTVLYTPTWRDEVTDSTGQPVFEQRLDLARLRDALADRYVFLHSGHPLMRASMSGIGSDDFVRNVSGYPDIAELYLASDVLITDYSSTMFDYAVTRRPMIFFAYDLAEYEGRLRGFYFDYAEVPGPIVATTDGVIDALADLDALVENHAEAYERFVTRFCSLEDGRASARIVDRVFGTT